MEQVEKIKNDFNEVVKAIDDQFGSGYARSNPGLVQDFLEKIQQQETRELERQRLKHENLIPHQ